MANLKTVTTVTASVLIFLIVLSGCSRASPSASPSPTATHAPIPTTTPPPGLQLDVLDTYSTLGIRNLADAMQYPQGIFLILEVRMRNLTKMPITVRAADVMLEDAQGRKFSISSVASTAAMSSSVPEILWLLKEMQPSLADDVTLIFDVPPEYMGLTLIVLADGRAHRTLVGNVDLKKVYQERVATIQAMTKKIQQDGGIGELVVAQGWVLTVIRIEEYQETSSLRPKAEDRRFAVYVSLGNSGQKTLTSNPYYFKLFDSEGQSHFPAVSMHPQEFKSGRLDPGEKQIGYVLFDVPRQAVPQELRYEPIQTPPVSLIVHLQ